VQQMLIVGINGSVNRNGNTAALLELALAKVAAAGAKTALIHVQDALAGLASPYCTLCTPNCSGECFQGKPLAEAYRLLMQADGILVGSPVCFGTVSAQLKCFWDKTRCLRKSFALYNKVGGAIATGSSRFGGQETTVRAIQDMLLVQGMIVVGTAFDGGEPGHQGACGQRPIDMDENARRRTIMLAERVLQVAGKIKG